MIKNHQIIETILSNYKTVLGQDFSVYKNHIYRVFNTCILLDTNKENHDKYAIAVVFHDIGIWTHNFDYLKPSIALAEKYLEANNLKNWTNEIALIIDNHHKISNYKNDFKLTVNTFRKADWIDVTNGIKLFKLPKKDYKNLKKEFSNNGFHLFLLKQWFAWFLKHPLNSLPMFRY